MALIVSGLSDETLARLMALAEETGSDIGTVIERLLDRDPHDHNHRCPTCTRVARAERERFAPHEDQHALFDGHAHQG